MIIDIVIDRFDQYGYIPKRATTDALVGNLAEPPFDHVQPRTRSRNKVQVKPRISFEPSLHAGMLVSSVIVHNQVQVEASRGLAVYFFEETDKLLMPMARQAVADNRTVEHAEGRK